MSRGNIENSAKIYNHIRRHADARQDCNQLDSASNKFSSYETPNQVRGNTTVTLAEPSYYFFSLFSPFVKNRWEKTEHRNNKTKRKNPLYYLRKTVLFIA